MKEIVIVSHCILNDASKVKSTVALTEEENDKELLMSLVRRKNIQLIQLPCPEFILYGAKRWGHVKEQFDHPFFREQCRELLKPYVLQIKTYAAYKEEYELSGIIAIDGSPSCGYGFTCRGNWGGELSDNEDLEAVIKSLEMVNASGVFMEELEQMLQKEKLDIPIYNISKYIEIRMKKE